MTNSQKEQWKPVPSMDGYEASNKGNVRKNGVLVNHYNDRGYRAVSYSVNGKSKNKHIHRMVAEAFGLDLTHFIDHKDGDRANNHLTNLRPAKLHENNAWANSRDPKLRGSYYYWKKYKSCVCVSKNGESKIVNLGVFNTAEEAAKVAAEYRSSIGME